MTGSRPDSLSKADDPPNPSRSLGSPGQRRSPAVRQAGSGAGLDAALNEVEVIVDAARARADHPARRFRGSGLCTASQSASAETFRHNCVKHLTETPGRGPLRARLPASVASIEQAAADADPQAERWLRVDLRAERLDWLPAVLASLDRPFVIEQPDELRGLVIALAERLAASARGG